METDFYHHDINIIFYNNDLLIGDHITVLFPLQGHTTLIQGLTLNLFFLLPGRSLSITAMTRSEGGRERGRIVRGDMKLWRAERSRSDFRYNVI